MPTNETKLQFITDECVKANPSIKDLVFGCQFLWKPTSLEKEDEIRAIFENWVTKDETIRCLSRLFFQQVTVRKDSITKIFGREIRLADCLLAIWKKDLANRTNIIVESAGTFIVTNWKNGGAKNIGADWNLLKDSLSDQSPETLTFIFNLLNN